MERKKLIELCKKNGVCISPAVKGDVSVPAVLVVVRNLGDSGDLCLQLLAPGEVANLEHFPEIYEVRIMGEDKEINEQMRRKRVEESYQEHWSQRAYG